MTTAPTDDSTLQKPLRLWPGVVLVVLQWLGRFVVPVVMPEAMPFGMLGALACGLAIIVWWVFFSRAPRADRWGALSLMVVGLVATRFVLHESIATGMMGMMYFLYVVPVLSLGLVVWAVACRSLANGPRRVALAATILLACGGWTLVRTAGFTGDGDSDFSWRWAKTAEERLLAEAADVPITPPTASAAPEADLVAQAPEWPGFRGPGRDGSISGTRIATDWSASPPVELWRRPVGPGWSSFAVRGDLFYTQEQRGDDEAVSCYRVSTGEPVWRHDDAARFWESNAGAGPRATPTLHGGRGYTLGATGIVNALDAVWAFSGSPWIEGDLVLVAVSGRLAAYDLETGELRWLGPDSGVSYSSPHRMILDGVPQILLLGATGAVSVSPVDGAVLWEHEWKGYPIVQPARTADGDVLLSVSDRSGLRRLAVAEGSGGWTVEERWTSIRLKPYFNDFVVHKGHAYGFDGAILAAIDLADGERKWKGGRYGNGQLLLLADQDVLLILSEQGELALVGATPDRFTEIARFAALEGRTWNHPVLVGDVLLVRNDREMAAFRLALGKDRLSSSAGATVR